MKSCTNMKLGHVGSKGRLHDQILEKPCVSSRGHLFSKIIMKLGQDVYVDEISDNFENRSCLVKN